MGISRVTVNRPVSHAPNVTESLPEIETDSGHSSESTELSTSESDGERTVKRTSRNPSRPVTLMSQVRAFFQRANPYHGSKSGVCIYYFRRGHGSTSQVEQLSARRFSINRLSVNLNNLEFASPPMHEETDISDASQLVRTPNGSHPFSPG